MVDVVSTISSSQNTSLKPSVQSAPVASAPPEASNANTDFVTSCIYVDNLQNVAILEYRSSQTGEVVQQYPNQAQINAFKAAQQLAHQASLKQDSAPTSDVHQAAVQSAGAGASDHVATTPAPPAGSSGGSSGGKTTSIIA